LYNVIIIKPNLLSYQFFLSNIIIFFKHNYDLIIIIVFSVDSIDKLKARLGNLENELRDPIKFKDFYHFTFNYAKNTGQKGLDLDMAIAYWNIVLDDKFKFLQLWCQFLQVNNLKLKFISYKYILR